MIASNACPKPFRGNRTGHQGAGRSRDLFLIGKQSPHPIISPSQSRQSNLVKKYLVEFIGTFFLVMTVGMTVIE
jgi:hypothetical protein